jgi:hypothetical protein
MIRKRYATIPKKKKHFFLYKMDKTQVEVEIVGAFSTDAVKPSLHDNSCYYDRFELPIGNLIDSLTRIPNVIKHPIITIDWDQVRRNEVTYLINFNILLKLNGVLFGFVPFNQIIHFNPDNSCSERIETIQHTFRPHRVVPQIFDVFFPPYSTHIVLTGGIVPGKDFCLQFWKTD